MRVKDRIAHILIVVQNLSVPLDRRVWLECRALFAAGYEVSVICPKGAGEAAEEILDGIAIYRYAPAPQARGLLGYAWEFAYSWVRTAAISTQVWRRSRFDVLQACNPPDTYWLLARLWRTRGVRFVYDQHDLNPELFESRFGRPSGLGSRFEMRTLLWLERMTYRAADHVVSTNESYRRVAQMRGSKRLDEITIVRSGPDTKQMTPIYPPKQLLSDHEFRLVYLGIMGPQDNVDVLLDVMDELVHRRGRTDTRLTLLGFGDCLEDLKRDATSRGLESWVRFTGRVGPVQIAQYLSAAHVGLSPDRKTPLNDVSTMNKVMEFMAFGLPCVSFDLVETRVTAADSALYIADGDVIEFANAIERLLADPDLRVQLGTTARARAEMVLDWRPQAINFVTMYDDVVRYRREGPMLELAPESHGNTGGHLVNVRDPVAFAGFLFDRGARRPSPVGHDVAGSPVLRD